ncbi:MAG: hypothetical protein CMJ46_14360 [Planctomyces sp.]|nr:hypothetical protein [Planctomyces sp.]
MAICRACKQEIPDGATKCHLCQSHQKWYQSPLFLSQIFTLPMFIVLYFVILRPMYNKRDFEDYRDQFSVERVATTDSSDQHLTYRITNNTDYKWVDISFEITMKKGDELLSVENDQEYSWVIRPHGQSLVTAYINHPPDGADTFDFRITDMKTERY